MGNVYVYVWMDGAKANERDKSRKYGPNEREKISPNGGYRVLRNEKGKESESTGSE